MHARTAGPRVPPRLPAPYPSIYTATAYLQPTVDPPGHSIPQPTASLQLQPTSQQTHRRRPPDRRLLPRCLLILAWASAFATSASPPPLLLPFGVLVAVVFAMVHGLRYLPAPDLSSSPSDRTSGTARPPPPLRFRASSSSDPGTKSPGGGEQWSAVGGLSPDHQTKAGRRIHNYISQ